MNFLQNKIKEDIERDGWSTIGVLPADESGPSFSYSVGFREHNGHPEVIIVGLPPSYCHAMIATLYARVAAGERFTDGQRIPEVVEDYDVELRALPPDGAPLNMARSYYGVEEIAALQVIWPDEHGVFPGEANCVAAVAEQQDVEKIRREDAQQSQEAAYAKLLPEFLLPASGDPIIGGEQLFELFKNWSDADKLDIGRFWSDFDITGDAMQEFSMRCGFALNTSPPIIGLMITFGAALAKARYRPKGLPEITI